MTPPLKATVVIPVYNEEGILESAVVGLVDRLEPFGISYEVLLAENGSRDNTVAISATPAFIDARWSSWRAERPSS